MKAILASCLCILSTTLLAQQDKIKDYHLDQEYKINSNGTLKLRCSDARVQITGSDRTNARVKIDRVVEASGLMFTGHDAFYMEINETDGDLDIDESKSFSASGIIGTYRETYTILIELPYGANLVVKGDDGDYKIRAVNGSISLALDDADVELTECAGGDFHFEMDDGDIIMDQGKGRLEIDADDADVKIRNGNFTSILADIDDGDLEIETSLTDNGEYFINAQDGLIAMTVTNGGGRFDIRHDDARVLTEGKFEKVEESDDRTRLLLASGNAKVDIRADDARVRLAKQ